MFLSDWLTVYRHAVEDHRTRQSIRRRKQCRRGGTPGVAAEVLEERLLLSDTGSGDGDGSSSSSAIHPDATATFDQLLLDVAQYHTDARTQGNAELDAVRDETINPPSQSMGGYLRATSDPASGSQFDAAFVAAVQAESDNAGFQMESAPDLFSGFEIGAALAGEAGGGEWTGSIYTDENGQETWWASYFKDVVTDTSSDWVQFDIDSTGDFNFSITSTRFETVPEGTVTRNASADINNDPTTGRTYSAGYSQSLSANDPDVVQAFGANIWRGEPSSGSPTTSLNFYIDMRDAKKVFSANGYVYDGVRNSAYVTAEFASLEQGYGVQFDGMFQPDQTDIQARGKIASQEAGSNVQLGAGYRQDGTGTYGYGAMGLQIGSGALNVQSVFGPSGVYTQGKLLALTQQGTKLHSAWRSGPGVTAVEAGIELQIVDLSNPVFLHANFGYQQEDLLESWYYWGTSLSVPNLQDWGSIQIDIGTLNPGGIFGPEHADEIGAFIQINLER